MRIIDHLRRGIIRVEMDQVLGHSLFPCLPSRGQLIGVIYKSKPGNLGIRDPPGGNKSQVAERRYGSGTPLVSWLYCSYYRAMHH